MAPSWRAGRYHSGSCQRSTSASNAGRSPSWQRTASSSSVSAVVSSSCNAVPFPAASSLPGVACPSPVESDERRKGSRLQCNDQWCLVSAMAVPYGSAAHHGRMVHDVRKEGCELRKTGWRRGHGAVKLRARIRLHRFTFAFGVTGERTRHQAAAVAVHSDRAGISTTARSASRRAASGSCDGR